MYCIFSSAKTMDETDESLITNKKFSDFISDPILLSESKILIDHLKALTQTKLGKLQNTSEKITKENYIRYQNFDSQLERAAVFMLNGHSYQKLNVKDFDHQELESLGKSLGILSGLYGILRPFDKARPYRLEPANGLKTEYGSTVSNFWKAKNLTSAVAELAKEARANTILNVASEEFTKAIDFGILEKENNLKTIHTSFVKEGGGRISSTYAKYARGHLVRFVAKSKANSIDDLTRIDFEGIRFVKQDENKIVFSVGDVSKSKSNTKKRSAAAAASSTTSKKSKKRKT